MINFSTRELGTSTAKPEPPYLPTVEYKAGFGTISRGYLF